MTPEEILAKIKLARSNHPPLECDIHDDDDPITCGWKSAVRDIDRILEES